MTCPYYDYRSIDWFDYERICKLTHQQISETTYEATCCSNFDKCRYYKKEKGLW
ncbi:MAG: hypothetical protein IJN77_07430 [Oscillospiraceae bacterium]|nr:hypothetical protein [Oscillospiraceae bacterium]